MAKETTTLQVKGLARRQVAAVARRASRLGMTPEGYLKHLVEEDLAISRRAKTKTFDDLMGVGPEADEAEIDRLVESAKTRYHKLTARTR